MIDLKPFIESENTDFEKLEDMIFSEMRRRLFDDADYAELDKKWLQIANEQKPVN